MHLMISLENLREKFEEKDLPLSHKQQQQKFPELRF